MTNKNKMPTFPEGVTVTVVSYKTHNIMWRGQHVARVYPLGQIALIATENGPDIPPDVLRFIADFADCYRSMDLVSMESRQRKVAAAQEAHDVATDALDDAEEAFERTRARHQQSGEVRWRAKTVQWEAARALEDAKKEADL